MCTLLLRKIISIVLMLSIPVGANSQDVGELYLELRKSCDSKEFYDFTISRIKEFESIDAQMSIEIASGKMTKMEAKAIFKEMIDREEDEIFRKRELENRVSRSLENEVQSKKFELKFSLARLSAFAVFVENQRPDSELRLRRLLNTKCLQLSQVVYMK